MKNSADCPGCGKPIPSDSPDGHCPHCLLEHALAAGDTGAGAETTTDNAPAAAEHPIVGVVRYMGDYELIHEIARGGMGVVYKARQVSLNRIVAIKMILSGQLAGEIEVRRFLIEAEAAANLQHPNIVAIHEVGEHEGCHYFSMDFVNGSNLAELAGRSPFPAAEAARVVQLIAEAIQYAHQRGILHRDMKPQNVLLDERGEPRITDFGLATRIENEAGPTVTGKVMGSPSYMAPEQAAARSSEVGPATDVYAIGAILYQLLTGRPPFSADSPMATIMKVIEEDAGSLRAVNPSIPFDLENICLKCLEKKPERRYPTARALAEDVGRFRNLEPVLARPASVWRKAVSWFRRNPWLTMLGMTAGLVLLLGAVFWLRTDNSVLRWKAVHPEFIPKRGPHTEALGKLMGSFSITTLVGVGIFLGVGGVASLLRRFSIPLGGLTHLTESPLFKTMPLLIMSGTSMVHGVLVIKWGVEAHLWEGHSVGLPLGLAFIFLYLGAFMAFEIVAAQRKLRLHPRAGNTSEDFYAGLPELARGDWEGFWEKAIKNLGDSPAWEGFQVRWKVTPWKVVIPFLTCGLAIWRDQALGADHGRFAFSGWAFFLFVGCWVNGCYWAAKSGQTSKLRAVLHAGAMMLTPLLVMLAILDSFGSSASIVLVQSLIGYALGFVGAASVLRWNGDGRQTNGADVSAPRGTSKKRCP